RKNSIGQTRADGVACCYQHLKDFGVTRTWPNNGCLWRLENSANDCKGSGRSKWNLSDACVGGDSNEGPQCDPGKPDDFRSTQNGFQPLARLTMLRRVCIVGVKQKICVGDNHRWNGPSPSSIKPSISSSSKPGIMPM